MKMETRKLTLLTATILILLFIINNNIHRIRYFNDILQSKIISVTGNEKSLGKEVSVIIPGRYRDHAATYRGLPEGFTQTGFLLYYKTEGKTRLTDVADAVIEYTSYYSLSRMLRDMKRINSLRGRYVAKGKIVIIPNPLNGQTPDLRNRTKPEIAHVKGLYYTGSTAGNINSIKRLSKLKNLGINSLVFDAKDITGIVNYRSRVEMVKKYRSHSKRPIRNIRMLIRKLKEMKIHTIARVALFHDHHMYRSHPEFAIRSKRTGKKWKAGRELWCDPTSRTVQDYNIAIAIELAEMGVDEIQFDYIRFPTSGRLHDAHFRYSAGRMSKSDVITGFLKRAYREISRRNTLLSIDIFGVVAWGKKVDIAKTGQNISKLYKYCDIISPMLYPSHFNNNFDERENPADHPYYYIYEGCKKVMELSNNSITVRPWLQSFKLKVSNYNSEYIMKQIKASDDAGGRGYLFWNAQNRYDTVYAALSSIN
jgi:hypothetical protein